MLGMTRVHLGIKGGAHTEVIKSLQTTLLKLANIL